MEEGTRGKGIVQGVGKGNIRIKQGDIISAE